ncbi:MAG: exopolysaccharide biosynthesis polyprenyl glycosylphosphotransferase [Actinobacteria bacterium]|nr:MAG: exopolysaccharide biosynthesis polyprenyl glycosylphosphotransferase [Actinomycetota bacterium]
MAPAVLRPQIHRVRRGHRLRPSERDFLVDATMLALAGLTAVLTAGASAVPSEGLPWLAAFPVLTLALLTSRGIYRPRTNMQLLEDTRAIVAATAVAAMTVVFARTLLSTELDAASQAVREWVIAAVYLIAGRAALKLSASGYAGSPTLIVGAGRVGHLLARRLLERPQMGLRPVGFVDTDPLDVPETSDCPVLGPPSQIEPLVRGNAIEHAILCFSTASHDEELEVMRRLRRLGVSVSVVPRLFEDIPDRTNVERVGGLPLLGIFPSKPRGWQFKLKYALDRVIAAFAILLAAPIMFAAALGTLVTLGRPILFRQRRVGLDGREFDMLKFRTMRPAAREDKPSTAKIEEALQRGLGPGGVEGQDRRSRFGAFLRRTSLDELPQLLNVVRGEMSIVGPRPERDHIAANLRESVYRYDARDRVKSGITGWAQVHGLRGRTSLTDRVEWDNYYIDNWSLWLDFKIVLMTVRVVVRDRSE